MVAGSGLTVAALLAVLVGPGALHPRQTPGTAVVLPDLPDGSARPERPWRAAVRCRSATLCTEIRTASAHRGPYLGAATDELLVLVEGSGLSAYELTSGARRWHLDLDINPMHPVPRVAAVDGEAAVAVAIPTGEVVAVDTLDGRIRWRHPAPRIEDVFAVRADARVWQATVRTRQDNTSSYAVVPLPPTGAPPPEDRAAEVPRPEHDPRCCDALVAAAARDGLELRPTEGVPGGLIQVLQRDSGRHLADLNLATYHGERLAPGRWLFVAPHAAVVVTTPPAT
ncbi:MAG TPA: PQQ-binding-like beta-propeller repeat protein [Egicoccus sp.]|nr:PQQ-binding-like beta-propeller repeat protein [Egicoccus sp.]HSK23915.1 PQQ-binding-like beta-propeller repeat protein [Egicoccus sp.]